MKKSIMVACAFAAVVLSIMPPLAGKSQSESNVQRRLEKIKSQTETIDNKLNQILEVEELPTPKDRKPKTVYRTKTKIKTVKVDRKVLIKVDNIYFEIDPEKDERGNYIVDWNRVNEVKEHTWEQLKLNKKDRPKRWYQKIFN